MRPNNLAEFLAKSILLRNSSRDAELKKLRLEIKRLKKQLKQSTCSCCEELLDTYDRYLCDKCDEYVCDECIIDDTCNTCKLKCPDCDNKRSKYCRFCPELLCTYCSVTIKCVCGRIDTYCTEECSIATININFTCPCDNHVCNHLHNNAGSFKCPICDTWYCDYCDAEECSCGMNLKDPRCSNCNYYISLKHADFYCCKDCGDIKCEDCSLPYICEC